MVAISSASVIADFRAFPKSARQFSRDNPASGWARDHIGFMPSPAPRA
jgi:hypothetical protein